MHILIRALALTETGCGFRLFVGKRIGGVSLRVRKSQRVLDSLTTDNLLIARHDISCFHHRFRDWRRVFDRLQAVQDVRIFCQNLMRSGGGLGAVDLSIMNLVFGGRNLCLIILKLKIITVITIINDLIN